MEPSVSDDIQRTLGRLEAKIDGFLTTLNDHKTELTTFEVRLRAVEKKVWQAGAVFSAAGTVIGFLVNKLF